MGGLHIYHAYCGQPAIATYHGLVEYRRTYFARYHRGYPLNQAKCHEMNITKRSMIACGWTTLSVASPQSCPLPWRYMLGGI